MVLAREGLLEQVEVHRPVLDPVRVEREAEIDERERPRRGVVDGVARRQVAVRYPCVMQTGEHHAELVEDAGIGVERLLEGHARGDRERKRVVVDRLDVRHPDAGEPRFRHHPRLGARAVRAQLRVYRRVPGGLDGTMLPDAPIHLIEHGLRPLRDTSHRTGVPRRDF